MTAHAHARLKHFNALKESRRDPRARVLILNLDTPLDRTEERVPHPPQAFPWSTSSSSLHVAFRHFLPVFRLLARQHVNH